MNLKTHLFGLLSWVSVICVSYFVGLVWGIALLVTIFVVGMAWMMTGGPNG